MPYQQSISFSGHMVSLRWPDLKSIVASKTMLMQHVVTSDGYTVFAVDGQITYAASLISSDVSNQYAWGDDYSQAQNDNDLVDFVTNFQSLSNKPIELRSADGRIVVRTTTANKAKNANLRIFSFVAGDPSTLINQDSNYNALHDITMTCYDVNGVSTTDPTQSVKSVIDLEPHYNFEVIGGWIDTPASLVGGTSGKWWISCVGVPDIPAAYGGSVNFVYPANLELVYTQKVISDGRASQYLIYDPTHHTNKLRWIMKHPTSATASVQIYIETFV